MVQSRREQLQAYRFMQRRVRTALLDADPDTNDAPMSRMTTATYAGIMVAILVLAVAGIYGIIRPGGSSAWKKAGALIVERETSTRYVYLDKVLYQVANFSSAKLLLGDRLSVVTVSGKSLSGARHGGSIGIPGAPDYLPDPKHTASASWSVCVAGGLSATKTNPTMYEPGVHATGGQLNQADGLLLNSEGKTYLLWNGHYFYVADKWLSALRYGDSPSVAVDADFLTAVPRGEDLQPVPVAGSGGKGPVLPGRPNTKVGQVLQDTLRNDIYYLVLPRGLAYLSPMQETLQLAQSSTRALNGGSAPLKIDSTGLTNTPISQLPNRPPAEQQAPKTIPRPVVPSAANQACVVFQGGNSTVVYGAAPPPDNGDASSGLVRLKTGYGALVGAVAHPGQQPSALYLVSDTGQKFVIKDAQVLTTLGLTGAPQAALPSAVVAAIPGTVVLDPAGARQVAGGGAGPTNTPS